MDWKLLLTTFGTLFVAELGDKTQLACVLIAADSIIATAELENKPSPNLRALALGGLRRARRDGSIDDWKKEQTDKLTAEPLTAREKLMKRVESLEKALMADDQFTCDGPDGSTILTGPAKRALEGLQQLLGTQVPPLREHVADAQQEADTEVQSINSLDDIDTSDITDAPEKPEDISITPNPEPVEVTPSDEDNELADSLNSLLGGLV